MDGVVVGPEAASISIFDRGFLYGDSIYEVLRTYSGVPFELEAHLERLFGSGRRLGLTIPADRAQLAEETRKTHEASGNADSYLRLMVTRGAGRVGLDPALATAPRRIVIAIPVDEMRPGPAVYEDGVEVSLVGVRRNLRDAIDPQAKTGNYLNSVLALAEAKAAGAYEAIMLDHRDQITEGASSNVFLVAGGVLVTPPLEAGILMGVTRAVVLRLAKEAGIRVLELPLNAGAFAQAEEVFITSSIREIVPVVRVDGVAVGDGRPGPVVRALRAAFAGYVARVVAAGGK